MKWSDFQSLIQLAIALNCAFATLSPFLGNAAQRDQYLASEYSQELDFFAESIALEPIRGLSIDALQASINTAISDFADILQRISTIDSEFIDFLNGKIRWFCVVFAFASLVLLFISSYESNNSFSYFVEIMVFVQFAPFLYGVAWVMLISNKYLIVSGRISALVPTIRVIEYEFKELRRTASNGLKVRR